MGKHRDMSSRQQGKETAKEVNKEQTRLINGWFRRCMEKGSEWADDKHREHVALARNNLTPDLMEICGVGEPSQIDHDNVHVKILWLMADPVNQRLAHNPRYRQRLYDKMDDEMLDVWNNYVGDDGHTYQELFEGRMASMRAVMYRRRLNKERDKMAE